MSFGLARILFLAMTLPVAVGCAYAFWIQPGGLGPTNPSYYGLAIGPLVIALLGVFASFAPFDSPRSALRWASALGGIAVGVGVGGLILFTPSFLALAGPLLLYAYALRALARFVARGNPSVSKRPYDASPETRAELQEGDDPSDPYGHGTTLSASSTLDDSDQAAEKTKGMNAILVVFAIAGVLLAWCWSPGSGSARPAGAIGAEIKSAIAPPDSPRTPKRVLMNDSEAVIEIHGSRIDARISLRRPTLVITLRDQTLVLQPCLQFEEATTDGFFVLPVLNTQRLSPGADADSPAQVQFFEGRDRVWVRVTYGGKALFPEASLGRLTAGLGRRAGADDMSAVLDVSVELSSGRVTVDARTTLARSAGVHRGTLSRLDLRDARKAQVLFGLGPEGLEQPLAQRSDGEWTSPLSFLTTDGTVTRFLKARRRAEGPFEGVELGEFGHWVVLPGRHEPLLVVAPDWVSQASLEASRSAGHGLLENALVGWWEGETITLRHLLAGTPLGSPVSTALPAGLYRNRVVIAPLGRRKPSQVAAAELDRIGAAREARASASDER